MRNVQALLENQGTRQMLYENSHMVNEAVNALGIWRNTLQNYISENCDEFIENTLEETAKSVYTFSTFATKQFLCEISQYYGKMIDSAQVLKEHARNEFS